MPSPALAKDKQLITSLVVVAAAVAALNGVEVSEPERQALVDGISTVVAGLAGVYAVGRVLVLRLYATLGE